MITKKNREARKSLKIAASIGAFALSFGAITANPGTAAAWSIVGCPVDGGTATVTVPSTGYVLTITQPGKRAWIEEVVAGQPPFNFGTTYLDTTFTIPWESGITSKAYEFWEWDDPSGYPVRIGIAPQCTITANFGSTSGGGGGSDKTDRNYGHSGKNTDPNRDRKDFSSTPKK